MKKTYKTPLCEAYSVVETELICASAKFGNGNTDTMHAKESSFGLEGTITTTSDVNLDE